jgi:hypothetical protein
MAVTRAEHGTLDEDRAVSDQKAVPKLPDALQASIRGHLMPLGHRGAGRVG